MEQPQSGEFEAIIHLFSMQKLLRAGHFFTVTIGYFRKLKVSHHIYDDVRGFVAKRRSKPGNNEASEWGVL